jgi:hypothetical protein
MIFTTYFVSLHNHKKGIGGFPDSKGDIHGMFREGYTQAV